MIAHFVLNDCTQCCIVIQCPSMPEYDVLSKYKYGIHTCTLLLGGYTCVFMAVYNRRSQSISISFLFKSKEGLFSVSLNVNIIFKPECPQYQCKQKTLVNYVV